MYEYLSDFLKIDKISKDYLLSILRNLSKKISVNDLILASAHLHAEGEYIQATYRKEYQDIYIKYFIMRTKEIKENKNNYKGEIDKQELLESINLLKNQFDLVDDEGEDKFHLIYSVVSLYTTYILDEPIHPVGTPFPGNLMVTVEDGIYYCPVKENNEDNPLAVCKFCIALQSEM
jgi:uncharacterized protein (UPF0305 family)